MQRFTDLQEVHEVSICRLSSQMLLPCAYSIGDRLNEAESIRGSSVFILAPLPKAAANSRHEQRLYTAARGKCTIVHHATQLAVRYEQSLPATNLPWSAPTVTLTAELRNSVAHITAAKTARG